MAASFFVRETLTILKIVSGGAVVVGGALAGYEQFRLSRDPPAPGRLVGVGGKKLHCEVSGESNTSPTVVFEGGSGETTLDWARVSRKVSKQAKCVSYDRAGLGFSEAGNASDPVDDLGRLLVELGIDGPIVLVAQGAGAFNARAFIQACENGQWQGRFQVSGAVFVDPVCDGVKAAHKSLHPRVAAAIVSMEESTKSFTWMAHFGVSRNIIADQKQRNERLYPPQLLPLLPAAKGTAKHRQAMADELQAAEAMEEALAATQLPPTMPLIVLAREDKTLFSALQQAQVPAQVVEQMEVVWLKAQVELAAQSSAGECFEVPGGGHLMAQAKPDEVASAVERLLKQLE